MIHKTGTNLMTLAAGEYCIDYRRRCRVSVLNYSGEVLKVSETESGLNDSDNSVEIEDGTAINELDIQYGKLYISTPGKAVIVRCR